MGFDRDSAIGFIGAGVVANTLAVALAGKGYRVMGAASRRLSSAQALAERVPGTRPFPTAQAVADACDFVFITTSDDAIEAVASSLRWRRGQGVAHCSGVHSLGALSAAEAQGALVGSLHPCQTFPSVERALESLPGSAFAVEGGPQVAPFLESVAEDLGGRPFRLGPGDRALYHATVVALCGVLVGYTGAVADAWGEMGLGREAALGALLPLMRETVRAMESAGLPGALTGPYARGDVGTVRRHLEALRSRAPHLLEAYRHMALAGLRVAEEKGRASPAALAEIRRLLEAGEGRG